MEDSPPEKASEEAPGEHSPVYTPNFVFGGNRVISEDNWAEYEAQGVCNVVPVIPEDDEDAIRAELLADGRRYLPQNVLLGDAFDSETGRPLRLKPGIGVYVTAEGIAYHRQRFGESSEISSSPPVMVLPDGTGVVARPGVTGTVRDSQVGESRRAQ